MLTREGGTAEFLGVHCGSFEVFPVTSSVVSQCDNLEVVGYHEGKVLISRASTARHLL